MGPEDDDGADAGGGAAGGGADGTGAVTGAVAGALDCDTAGIVGPDCGRAESAPRTLCWRETGAARMSF